MRISPPNYTQLPNALIDYWMTELSHPELKVMLFIARKTFGWHKVRDRLSISQIDVATGCGRSRTCKTLCSLIERGLIIKVIEGELGNEKVYYELNITEVFIQKTADEGVSNGHGGGCPIDTGGGVQQTPTKERDTKERKKENTKEAACSPSPAPSAPAPAALAECDLLSSFNESLKKSVPEAPIVESPAAKKALASLLKLHPPDLIRKVILYAHQSEFWAPHVITPQYLKKKFTTIHAQMNRQANAKPQGYATKDRTPLNPDGSKCTDYVNLW